MELTNKTNQHYFWRQPGNRLFIEVDGKPVELKYTLAQNEAYNALIEEQKEAVNAKTDVDIDTSIGKMLQARISKSIEHASRVVTIAMNPKSGPQYGKDEILELFGEQLDLLQIVARTWVDKKIFNPSLDKALDPHLAP